MNDEIIRKCPLTGQDCTPHCAWFKDGECLGTHPDLMDTLDDVIASINELERTIKKRTL